VHEPSGYGCEFAIAVRVPDPWCLDLLQQLMTYTRIATERVAPGHRLPTAFFAENDGTHFPWIKSVRHDDPVPMSEIRAIILWPYKAAPKSLQTATGTFGILAATLITGDEWEAAKQTSSAHVLLLLERAGISQLAEPNRRSVTSDRRWRSDWEEIRSMSDRQVQEMLLRGQE
jgi:hypothetical protein